MRFIDETKWASRPDIPWGGNAYMGDFSSYTDANTYQVYTGAGTIARAIFPTPGTSTLKGRNWLRLTYAAAITDNWAWSTPDLGVLVQINQPVYFKASCATGVGSTFGSKSEFFMGYGTTAADMTANPIGTAPADIIAIRKKVDETVFSVVTRKASGTEAVWAIPGTNVGDAGDVWEFSVKAYRDVSTAGRGVVEVCAYKNELVVGAFTVPIASSFPDTQAMGVVMGTRSGVASNVTYLGHIEWQVGPSIAI